MSRDLQALFKKNTLYKKGKWRIIYGYWGPKRSIDIYDGGCLVLWYNLIKDQDEGSGRTDIPKDILDKYKFLVEMIK